MTWYTLCVIIKVRPIRVLSVLPRNSSDLTFVKSNNRIPTLKFSDLGSEEDRSPNSVWTMTSTVVSTGAVAWQRLCYGRYEISDDVIRSGVLPRRLEKNHARARN
ncbi:hypothetical protein ElyMa_001605100 [Elysia marginata]|uniref:Uncharacterized protein n=1 Tax=Elysia marginata TaxID=1093978 RepID=A0AAV4JGI3_9GAST|nr:hypothetical protein ElyMa_001605100 [Elysia marginata]